MRSKIHLWRLDIYKDDRANVQLASLTNAVMPDKQFHIETYIDNETPRQIVDDINSKKLWDKNVRLAKVFVDGRQWPRR